MLRPMPPSLPPTLSAMTSLDRSSSRRRNETDLDQLLTSPQARILAMVGAKPVIRSSADRRHATLAVLPRDTCPAGPLHHLSDLMFLGIDTKTEHAIFVRVFTPDEAVTVDPDGGVLAPAIDLRSLAMQGVLEPGDLAIAATAAALANWHDSARYCGRCGQPTTPRDGGWLRHCQSCNGTFFPRTDPVAIMLVTAGDQCVLARQSMFPEGMLSTLAGFLEPGETIETAIVRETEEEIGIRARDVKYLASQPWPFPHSLMIGCIATADCVPLTVDLDELESARWVSRAEVRQMLALEHPQGLWVPGPHAIARTLITHFAA